MNSRQSAKATAVACLVVATLCWGSIPIFLRYFTNFLGPWTVNGIRYSTAAVFWLPFVLVLWPRSRREASSASRSPWRDALVPFLVNVFGQVGYGVSPYFLPASTIGFALRVSFLFTVVLGFVFLAEERPLARRPAFWLGAVASLAGVALLFAGRLRLGDGNFLVGMAILLAATLSWGAYGVSVRKFMAPYPARLSFGIISIYTSSVLLVLMVALGRLGRLADLSLGLWGMLIGSGLLGVAFGHVLYFRALHRLGPIVCAGVMLATPFVTYLGAALFLGERLTVVQFAGGLLVVVGGAVLLMTRSRMEQVAG